MTPKYLYQQTNRYFAQTADDLTELAAAELISLGAQDTRETYRGLYFTASQRALYRINFHSRIVTRILAPLISFSCHSDRYLYRRASEVQWQDFLDPSRTFAVFANVANSKIKHSKFAALRLKDAVVDFFRARMGARPTVDTRNPDVWIHLFIENDEATISLDTSGGSLHRRGYRKKSVEAPMIETLAAAIVVLSDWDGKTLLCDPFCGSGTLLCEAYLKACVIPSGVLRAKFGFENLPDFDAELWSDVREQGVQATKSIEKGLISGSDISAEAVSAASENLREIDPRGLVEIRQQNVFDYERIERQTIVCNPPYGVRLESGKDLSDFYRRFGDFLKQRCQGSTAYIYFGERKYIKNIGLRPSWKRPLSSGGLDGRLVKYVLY